MKNPVENIITDLQETITCIKCRHNRLKSTYEEETNATRQQQNQNQNQFYPMNIAQFHSQPIHVTEATRKIQMQNGKTNLKISDSIIVFKRMKDV